MISSVNKITRSLLQITIMLLIGFWMETDIHSLFKMAAILTGVCNILLLRVLIIYLIIFYNSLYFINLFFEWQSDIMLYVAVYVLYLLNCIQYEFNCMILVFRLLKCQNKIRLNI